jgi:hypothetical protein
VNRPIIYSEEVPRSFDVLSGWKDTATALSWLFQDVLGSSAGLIAGLAATPTGPASLTINLAQGRVYQLSALDSTGYGSLASDSTVVVQQGTAAAQTVTVSLADLTSGKSKWALIQAQVAQVDVVRSGDPTSGILQFWNAANPTQPLEGQANNGQPLPTVRTETATVNVIYGAIANTGVEVPPNPSAGFIGLYLIDLAFGQTAINSNQILVAGPSVGANVPSNYPQAPFLAGALNQHHKGTSGQAPQIDLTSEVKNALPYANISPVRQKLANNLSLFVNASTGNDTTGDGLTSGTAWATLQKAWNVIQATYDPGAFVITVSVADGTDTGGLVAQGLVPGQLGYSSIVFQGNTGTPANCIISTSGSCIKATGGARFTVKGFKLLSSGGSGIDGNDYGTEVGYSQMSFGACAAGNHVVANLGAQVIILGNYTISGGAINHWIAQANGVIAPSIESSGFTITLTGTPAFSHDFADATKSGTLYVPGLVFSGSATGARYLADLNGVIWTGSGGANYFPGNSAGSTLTGGQYA